MQTSKPSSVLVENPDGSVVVCRCLSCTKREEFLELWDAAWQIVKADEVAQQMEPLPAISHVWDSSQEFRFLCLLMLEMHSLSVDLDLPQMVELLFVHENNNGLLVKLQFPPLPLGTKPQKPDNTDPYAKLLAILAYRTGDWAAAKQALDTIPYDKLIEALQVNVEGSEKASPPAPDPAKQESLLQRSREMFQEGAIASDGMEAIKAKVAAMRNT